MLPWCPFPHVKEGRVKFYIQRFSRRLVKVSGKLIVNADTDPCTRHYSVV